MQPRNTSGKKERGRHEHRLPNEISKVEKQKNKRAHEEAEHDMEEDAELTAQNPNDDLDEEEAARLSEDDNGIV
jgi:hypothetical protein